MRNRIITASLLAGLLSVYSICSNQSTASPGPVIVRGSLHGRGFSVEQAQLDTVQVAFSLPQCLVQPRSIGGARDDVVSLEGGESPSAVGEFDLPVFHRLVAVPDGGEVTLFTRVQKMETVRNIFLKPSARRPNAGKAPIRSDGRAFCRVEFVCYLRDQRLAMLEVSPVLYNRQDKTLNVVSDMEISVAVRRPRGPAVKNVGPMQAVVEGTVLNMSGQFGGRDNTASAAGRHVGSGAGQVCWATGSNWQDAATSAAACGADYLILVSDSLASSAFVDSMALCRASKNNFNVAIVKVSQVDATPDTASTPIAIRALIDSVYTARTAAHMADGHLGYVLLLGDAYDASDVVMLPSYYGYADLSIAPTTSNDKYRASDAYYSFLDDDPAVDRLPDVFIGRLPVDKDVTDWEISNLVRKIVNYEPLSSTAWADSVLLVSGSDKSNFSFSGVAGSPFQSFFDSVLTYYPISGRHVVQMNRLSYPSTGDSVKNRIFGNKVAASMKRGKWLTAYLDHGSPFYWVGAFYARSFDNFATATTRPPVIFSIGSNTCQFDLTKHWGSAVMGTCLPAGHGCMIPAPSSIQCESPGYGTLDACDVLAERLLVQPGGAVAVIGYSRTTQATSSQTDFTNLFRSLADQNPTTLGELLIGARMFNITNDVTARNLMLLGDPALDIRNRVPDVADTVDVAVGTLDIACPSAPYLRPGSNPITITVRNEWRTNALGVGVELWSGHPDSTGSSLLDSTGVDTLRAYGKATVNFNVSGMDGDISLFVRLDPNNVLPERQESNNLAARSFLALPYEGGFPARLNLNSVRPIVVADLRAEIGKEFLVTGWGPNELSVLCYSAADTVPKWSFSADTLFTVYSNPAVGHVYKSASDYVAMEYGNPLKVRLLSGQTGSLVKTRVSNNRSPSSSKGCATWTISDYGPDDAAMEFTALLYRRHGGAVEDTLLLRAFAPNSAILSTALVDVGFGVARPATLAVGDIDANGTKEAVVLCNYAVTGNELQAFSYSGGFAPLWHGDVSDGSALYEPGLVLFDRDSNGTMEVLCTGHYFSGSFVRLYSSTGTLLWVNDLAVSALHRFSAGDIDADGDAEVVVADHQRLRIVSSLTGTASSTRTLRGDPASVPYLVDIDNDGKLNIVVLYEESPNPYPYPRLCLTHLYVLDENLDEVGPHHTFTGPTPTPFVPAESPSAIVDLDGDGKFEMVYASRDQYLHVFELGSSAGEAAWQQRFGNELLTGVNEQPIVGHYNDPVSLYQRTRMLGDVVLDSTLAPSLYIGYGTQVRVDTSTVAPFRLKAFGSVRIKGSSAAPVTFSTVPASSAEPTWGGLYFNNRFSTVVDPDTLSRFVLSDASVGIATRSPTLIKNSTISGVFDAAIDATDTLDVRDCVVSDSHGAGVISSSLSLSLQHCTIDEIAATGVSLLPGGTAIVDSTTIQDCDIGLSAYACATTLTKSGINDCLSYGALFKDGRVRVLGTSFQGNDVGAFAATDASDGIGGTVRNCSFTYNNNGIEVDDVGDSTFVIDQCTLDHNTTSGIYVEDGGSVSVTDNDISYNSFGLFSYHSGPHIHWHNGIEHNGNGIKADGSSYAAIESCMVANNNYGVTVVSGNPDIGTVSGGSSLGYNILKPNTTYNVRNLTGLTINAQQNYWPQKATSPMICYPKPSTIYGSVDTTAALCSQPALTAPGPWAQPKSARALPQRFELGQNYPNPFNPQTTVTFDVPRSVFVRIAVYDVAGRLVDVLVNDVKQPGFYQAAWKGHDRRGQQVATGVYFLHMTAGSFTQTRKMVLLK